MTHAPTPDVWVHEHVAVGPSAVEGRGLIATAPIAAGAPVLRLGGHLVGSASLAALLGDTAMDPGGRFVDTVTVDDDAHLVLPEGTIAHFGNHSCDPTMWHVGPYELVARRAIGPGDELTLDYATNSGAAGWAMACRCRSRWCRGEITSEDWRRPELRERYGSHWTPALLARIAHG